MERITELDMAVRAVCPIDGLARLNDGTVRIDFKNEATAQQRSAAQAVVAAFDWTPRRPRPLTDLLADIQALAAADRNKLLAAVSAEFLRGSPRFARKLGIALDGDEPDV